MALVIVERAFDKPASFAELQALEDAFEWCKKQNEVVFLRSYFSASKTRMICLYEAPDAEAVRRVNRTAGLPFEQIWAGTQHDA
jgi:hypothetical protein